VGFGGNNLRYMSEKFGEKYENKVAVSYAELGKQDGESKFIEFAC
jgi:hypothetical protein